MDTKDVLINRATTIINETAPFANDGPRVGSLIKDVVEYADGISAGQVSLGTVANLTVLATPNTSTGERVNPVKGDRWIVLDQINPANSLPYYFVYKGNNAGQTGNVAVNWVNTGETIIGADAATRIDLNAKTDKKSFYNITQSTGVTYTDSATARNAVPADFRGLGQQISYQLTGGIWVAEKYIGTTVSDWAKITNWEKVLTTKDSADFITYNMPLASAQSILFSKMVRAVYTTGLKLTAGQSLRIGLYGLASTHFQSYPFGIQIALNESGVLSKHTSYIYQYYTDLKNNAILQLTPIGGGLLSPDLKVYVVLSNQYESLNAPSYDSTVIELTQGAYNWYLDPLLKKYITDNYVSKATYATDQENIGDTLVQLNSNIVATNVALSEKIESTATGGNTYKVILPNAAVDIFKTYIGEIYITGLKDRANPKYRLTFYGAGQEGYTLLIQISVRNLADTGWENAANYTISGTLKASTTYKLSTNDPNAKQGVNVYIRTAASYVSPPAIAPLFIGAYVELTPLAWNNFVPMILQEQLAILSGNYTYKPITVQRNAANFNSIRETVAALTSDYYNRYIVLVPKGRWFECDLIGKEYVQIVGEDMLETILYCDGLSTKLTPLDYSFPSEANKPLNTIAQQYKHVFNARKNIAIRNLKVEGNDIKYGLHIDNEGFAEFSCRYCRISINSGVNYPVGIGARSGQSIEIIGCELTRESSAISGQGVFFHNWNNQDSPVKLHIESSKFTNCGFMLIDELGSGQNDQVNLINCYSDTGGEIEWMVDYRDDTQTTYWINPSTGVREANPQNVPYSIKLNASGSNVGSVRSQKFPYGDEWVSRPDALKTMITDYFRIWKTAATLSVGDCVQGYTNGVSTTYSKYTGASPFIGVITFIKDQDKYIIHRGNIAVTPVVIPVDENNVPLFTISIGQHVKINTDGRLEFIDDNNEPYVGIYVGDSVDKYKIKLI